MLNSSFNVTYTYDGLNRLKSMARHGDVAVPSWGLDALGNWASFTQGSGANETTQTRDTNEANEITSISSGIQPQYDAAGNMTKAPKPSDPAVRLHFKYDAWNRLVQVFADVAGDPGSSIARYEYDARNYRIQKTVDDVIQGMFYNDAWQNIETREYSVTTSEQTSTEQSVWDLRYIDAPVVQFRDSDADDVFEQSLYFAQDANFNVTALLDGATGSVLERYSYDPSSPWLKSRPSAAT